MVAEFTTVAIAIICVLEEMTVLAEQLVNLEKEMMRLVLLGEREGEGG